MRAAARYNPSVRFLALSALIACAPVPAELAPDIAPDGRPLREVAAPHDRRIGTFLWFATTPDAAFQRALAELDMYIVPVFFRQVQPERGTWDFTLADGVADAAPPGTVLYVPGLITNDLIPDWLASGNYTGEQLRAFLEEFVSTVTAHFATKYPGRVIAFEIVLEPLSWPAGMGFWHRIGVEAGGDANEYIRIAYRTARATVPDAKLYIDDFGVEGPDRAKAERYFALVTSLLADGTPLDGVAFEGHFALGGDGPFPDAPSEDVITGELDRYGELGLETMITSVDVALREVTTDTLATQAASYRRLVRGCLRAPSCKAFATWGLGDTDSWIPQYFEGWGAPLMFDAAYARKPAYDAVWNELAR